MQAEFLEILELALKRAGSVRKLAEYLGCNPSAITRWKAVAKPSKGEGTSAKKEGRSPNIESIQGVLNFLGCSWCEALQLAKPSANNSKNETVAALKNRIAQLEAQVRALEVYKHKWEGHLESMAVQSSGTLSVSELHAYQSNSSEKESARKSTTGSLGNTKAG